MNSLDADPNIVTITRYFEATCEVCGGKVKRRRRFRAYCESSSPAVKMVAGERLQKIADAWEPARVHDRCARGVS